MTAQPPADPMPMEQTHDARSSPLWIERLTLTNFRNYAHLSLELDARPVVLTGSNGAGKTNLLEAVSLLAPGRGLRRTAFNELARMAPDLAQTASHDIEVNSRSEANGGSDPLHQASLTAVKGSWAVAANLQGLNGPVSIGTGLSAATSGERSGRIVRINGETQTGSGALAQHVETVWLIPAMDGLFTGPASERRRFLDRLIVCFDPGYRRFAGIFERAMRQRNRLLDNGVRDDAQLLGLELQMAQAGVAIVAARGETVAQLRATIQARRDLQPDSPFPWGDIALQGRLENDIGIRPAVDVEDDYLQLLTTGRERDRAAGRCLEGPHRSDLLVGHGPKSLPAQVCSTGEQKALLVGLILAHATLVKQHRDKGAPILLLDEIAAHLDVHRRTALFQEIIALGSQAWMTGTDASAFEALERQAQFFNVEDAKVQSGSIA